MKSCCATSKAAVAARLEVDGKKVPMKAFVQDFVGRTVLGMLSALKGVDAPRTVVLKVKVPATGFVAFLPTRG